MIDWFKSVFLIAGGVTGLLKSLVSIGWATLSLPRPDFHKTFEDFRSFMVVARHHLWRVLTDDPNLVPEHFPRGYATQSPNVNIREANSRNQRNMNAVVQVMWSICTRLYSATNRKKFCYLHRRTKRKKGRVQYFSLQLETMEIDDQSITLSPGPPKVNIFHQRNLHDDLLFLPPLQGPSRLACHVHATAYAKYHMILCKKEKKPQLSTNN